MRQNPIFSTSFSFVTFTHAKYRIFISFSFSQDLVLVLFTPPLPPIPIFHILFILFVRHWFSLLVSSFYCRRYLRILALTSYSYNLASLLKYFNYRHEQTPAFVLDQHCTEHGRTLTRHLDFGGIPLVV